MRFAQCLEKLPLFAVLRGVTPHDVDRVGGALIEAGFAILEVTLNSPQPLKSIEILARRYGGEALIGAGTVTRPCEVEAVKSAGGNLIISPHMDPALITETKSQGLISLPGVLTPSEAFAALAHSADGLKIFPAEIITPAAVKALRAVLPKSAQLFVVGGVNADTMLGYLDAGANGFGIGSSLYKAGKDISEIRTAAKEIIAAYHVAAEKRP